MYSPGFRLDLARTSPEPRPKQASKFSTPPAWKGELGMSRHHCVLWSRCHHVNIVNIITSHSVTVHLSVWFCSTVYIDVKTRVLDPQHGEGFTTEGKGGKYDKQNESMHIWIHIMIYGYVEVFPSVTQFNDHHWTVRALSSALFMPWGPVDPSPERYNEPSLWHGRSSGRSSPLWSSVIAWPLTSCHMALMDTVHQHITSFIGKGVSGESPIDWNEHTCFKRSISRLLGYYHN